MTAAHFVPFVGKEVKLGKGPKRHDSRTLQFAEYKTVSLPRAPKSISIGDHVTSFPMFANDQFGDCTCAAIGHQEQVWTATGAEYVASTDEVLALYWATGTPPNTPCQPGGATDTGRVELDVLNYWKNTGFGTSQRKIVGYAEINPHNTTEVKQGLWLFGGLYIGVALPLSAQSQNEWSVVKRAGSSGQPGSWGGHAVNVVAYDSTTLTVVTWGRRLKMTWGFWDKYVDEVYAILSPDWVNPTGTSNSPTGFNFNQLETDLSGLR